MDLLSIIKRKCAVRQFKNRPISNTKLNKILEAGLWSSSIHGMQPWEFIVVKNKKIKNRISRFLIKKAFKIGRNIDKLFTLTANTISNSPVIILVYNEKTFQNISQRMFKIPLKYLSIAQQSETEAISAAVQNMLLEAECLGISSCWNTIPLFCENEISKLLKTKKRLLAILSFGYSREKTKRSPRKAFSETVKLVK